MYEKRPCKSWLKSEMISVEKLSPFCLGFLL